MSGQLLTGEWLRFTESAARYLFLNWGIQSTLVLAVGLVASGLPRLRPGTRHSLLLVTLLLAAAAPLSLWMPGEHARAQRAGPPVNARAAHAAG
ncbi:MAG: hypothetical protein K0Q72_4850, partial [Armatimonadetes bacterium]|nr:hypothetical protein [Armatimonadota bacterium]